MATDIEKQRARNRENQRKRRLSPAERTKDAEKQRIRRLNPKVRKTDAERQAAWRIRNPNYQREWAQKNREKKLQYARRALGVVNATGEEKSGACEICGKTADRLRYDHDHATGLFRGWLCHKCNVGLHYAEDPAWLERALRYIGR